MGKQNGLVHEECPSCGAKISIGSRALAKKIRCPKCRLVIVVPPKAAAEPASSHGVAGTLHPAEYPLAADPVGPQSGFLDEKQKSALLRHLSGNGKLDITISAPADDPDALLLSDTLQKLFHEAGWNALASASLRTNGKQERGLALYTGPWPFAEEVTRICMALTAAGLKFSSHIDPFQVREKAILVIGRDLRQLRREHTPGIVIETPSA